MSRDRSYLGALADVTPSGADEDVTTLLSTADRILSRSGSVDRFRQSRGRPSGDREGETWQLLSSLGITTACAPSQAGGSAWPLAAGILLAETFGRHLAPEPYLAGALLPTLALGAARSDVGDRLLAESAAGRALPVLALQEGPGIDELSHPACELAEARDGPTLRGRKRFVHGAAWATHFLVSARSPEAGTCLILADRTAPGLALDQRLAADGTVTADLVLGDVAVDRAHVLLAGHLASTAIDRTVNQALVAISAELFGLCTALFGMTMQYLGTRQQFDRPIGEFQALQHRSADLYCEKEIARFAIARAIATLPDCEGDAAAAMASSCKARAADSATRIARASVQLHGAIGFSDEADIGLYLKRILVLSAWFGNADHHRRRVARLSPFRID